MKNILQIPHLNCEKIYWSNPHQFIEPEFFKQLCEDFPTLDYFEWHDGYPRKHQQRPHNRFYLAYDKSLHHPEDYMGKGVIHHQDLPGSWQVFIETLENYQPYREFMRKFLRVPDFITRYEWHVAGSGCEVSPHIDASAKIGKHIFYFNTNEDWEDDWGGHTLILENKLTDAMNPDYAEFGLSYSTAILNNYSFLLRNGPRAWHGVKPLTCPQGKYRKILNVVWEHVDAAQSDLSYRANYVN